VVYGGRVSISVGIAAMITATIIGVAVGYWPVISAANLTWT
jgi:ABC-type dipeptide/oligopeptide/nickel transport system permease subunit